MFVEDYLQGRFFATSIKIVHILFICLLILAVFSDNERLQLFYIIIVPFLFFQWAFNQNMCTLTKIEAAILDKPVTDGFIYNIIKPIYSRPQFELNYIIYIYLIITWIYVITKYNNIKISL